MFPSRVTDVSSHSLKARAIALVRKSGGIKKADPNAVRSQASQETRQKVLKRLPDSAGREDAGGCDAGSERGNVREWMVDTIKDQDRSRKTILGSKLIPTKTKKTAARMLLKNRIMVK